MSTNKEKKPFSKWSREEKRRAVVTVKGKKMKVMDWIEEVARAIKTRYVAYDKRDTTKEVDHVAVMRKLYMLHGIDEVNKYLKLFTEATKQQTKEAEERAAMEAGIGAKIVELKSTSDES